MFYNTKTCNSHFWAMPLLFPLSTIALCQPIFLSLKKAEFCSCCISHTETWLGALNIPRRKLTYGYSTWLTVRRLTFSSSKCTPHSCHNKSILYAKPLFSGVKGFQYSIQLPRQLESSQERLIVACSNKTTISMYRIKLILYQISKQNHSKKSKQNHIKKHQNATSSVRHSHRQKVIIWYQ